MQLFFYYKGATWIIFFFLCYIALTCKENYKILTLVHEIIIRTQNLEKLGNEVMVKMP